MFCVQVVQITRFTLRATRCPISAWLWCETSACCPAKTLPSWATLKSRAPSSTSPTSSSRSDSHVDKSVGPHGGGGGEGPGILHPSEAEQSTRGHVAAGRLFSHPSWSTRRRAPGNLLSPQHTSPQRVSSCQSPLRPCSRRFICHTVQLTDCAPRVHCLRPGVFGNLTTVFAGR